MVSVARRPAGMIARYSVLTNCQRDASATEPLQTTILVSVPLLRYSFVGTAIELTAPEARRQGLFPLKCDVVESRCQRVPAGARRRFRAHDVRLGLHFHVASPKWPVHQADFDLDRRPWLNPLGTKKEDSAGADIGGSQWFSQKLSLSRDTLHAQRETELCSGITAPFFGREHGMRGNARDALRLGSRRPRRRVGNRNRRAGRQYFCRGVAAAGIGLVHEFLISHSAHRSPLVAYASGTARGHYPLANVAASIWVPPRVVLLHTPRRSRSSIISSRIGGLSGKNDLTARFG
jgi:hypothetical protein